MLLLTRLCDLNALQEFIKFIGCKKSIRIGEAWRVFEPSNCKHPQATMAMGCSITNWYLARWLQLELQICSGHEL